MCFFMFWSESHKEERLTRRISKYETLIQLYTEKLEEAKVDLATLEEMKKTKCKKDKKGKRGKKGNKVEVTSPINVIRPATPTNPNRFLNTSPQVTPSKPVAPQVKEDVKGRKGKKANKKDEPIVEEVVNTVVEEEVNVKTGFKKRPGIK